MKLKFSVIKHEINHLNIAVSLELLGVGRYGSLHFNMSPAEAQNYPVGTELILEEPE